MFYALGFPRGCALYEISNWTGDVQNRIKEAWKEQTTCSSRVHLFFQFPMNDYREPVFLAFPVACCSVF